PNGWATKTFQGVYGGLLFGVGLMVLILLLAIATFYGSRRGPQRQTALQIFVSVMYLMAIIFGGIGLLPLMRISPLVFLIPTSLFVVAVIWWSARGAENDPGESTPDECWHAGDLYYNP